MQKRITAPINTSIKHVACFCFSSEAKFLAADDTPRNNSGCETARGARTLSDHKLQSQPASCYFVFGVVMEKEFGFYRNTRTGCAAEGLKSLSLMLVQLNNGCLCKKNILRSVGAQRRHNYLPIPFLWDFLDDTCHRDN